MKLDHIKRIAARRARSFGATSLLALAGSCPALAQPSEYQAPPQTAGQSITTSSTSEGIEEIVVTARKVSENIQRTPISITAVTPAQLEARGITAIDKIANFTPNLTFTNSPGNSGASSNAAIYIRGIGQNDFAPSVEPGVGLYLDGVYLGTPVGSVFDLIDVERIEVLRGPQGTLFGKNTIGGAVNVATIQPNNIFLLRGDMKYGTDSRVNARLHVNLPIVRRQRLWHRFEVVI